MIKDLIRLANRLDEKGFQKEADMVDKIIKKFANEGVPVEESNATIDDINIALETLKNISPYTHPELAKYNLPVVELLEQEAGNSKWPSGNQAFREFDLLDSIEEISVGRVAAPSLQVKLLDLRNLLNTLTSQKEKLTEEQIKELNKQIKAIKEEISKINNK